MLNTIATGLAIDAYSPLSDNAGGIAEMAGLSHRIRKRNDALDVVENTTSAIGMEIAISSVALVSLALFGAFVSHASISIVDVLGPKVFVSLIVGAMLPYEFSAIKMKSVRSAVLKMVKEVRRREIMMIREWERVSSASDREDESELRQDGIGFLANV
ncbi:hypothetical protein Nepgr_012825 [Nepenthes gracilis]|uniref:H(+)-exporting diphosphatase n=1 Tax=Nepenthes gracilis TaxID=150966 RepID=A0AAD3SHZ9_NEPGR|nr:hypothetical protein Nepgr_012825 [Nepenthes gracilis]